MGKVINILGTMAQSSAVLKSFLGFSQALSEGSLPLAVRERIALAIGEATGCKYCIAAHTVLARKAGLTDEEILDARRGTASNDKVAVALELTLKIVKTQGFVGDEDIERARSMGYSDGDICEIVASVALNLFTNYFNHVAETDIDFPAVPALSA
jgi:AhpD family alkylhydroperoxidase